jgi:hypothetical protein
MHYFKKKLKNWKKYIYTYKKKKKEPGKALVDLVS